MPVRSSRAIARSRTSRRASLSCSRSTSTICAPMVWSGLSAVIGSWKIMAISPPRMARICGSAKPRRSLPSKTIRPEVVAPSTRPSTDSAVIDLPDPDSPTSANFSPAAIVSETSSTTTVAPKRTLRCSIARSVLAAVIRSTPRTGAVTAARDRSGARLGRGLEQRLARRTLARAVRRCGAQGVELALQPRHRGAVRAALVPCLQLGADLLQRTGAALVERVRLVRRFAPELRGRRLDRGLVAGSEVDQRAHVAGAPLQSRRRPFALLERLAVPAQRLGRVAALPGIARQLRHQVVRRMALHEVGLQQRVGLVAEAGALEEVRGGGDYRLALVAVRDLAIGACR